MDGLESITHVISPLHGYIKFETICSECGRSLPSCELIADEDTDGKYFYIECCNYRYIFEDRPTSTKSIINIYKIML